MLRNRHLTKPFAGSATDRPRTGTGLILAEVIGYYGLIGAAALTTVFLR